MIARSLQQTEFGPPEIRALPQWVVTKITPRPGQPTSKPPYVENGHHTLRLARGPVDERAHMPYSRASSLVREGREGMQWTGFVTLPTSNITGGDLDGCRDPRSGRLGFCRPRQGDTLGFSASALLAYLPTYWSVSPSGGGLRFWAQGSLPDGNGHWAHIGLEMYSQGQYLTETGQRLALSDRHARPLAGPLLRLFRAAETANKAWAPGGAPASRLRRLWTAPGTSESDLSFCILLSRYSQDPEVLELVMRLSGAYRPKWDERRGGGTWLTEEVIAPALDRSSPEAPSDLVEKRLSYLRADRDARLALAAEDAAAWTPPPVVASVQDWLLEDIPDPAWLVENLMIEDTSVLLAAEFKAGKTTLKLNLIRALLGRGSFLGCSVSPPAGRVVVVNGEMPPRQLRVWVREACRGADLSRLSIINVAGTSFDLRLPDIRTWLAEQLRLLSASVVILDTFSAVFGGEENANSEVLSFLRSLDQLKKDADCPNLVLVHHMGRKSHEDGREHGRGASALDGWADARWILTREGDARFFSAMGRDVMFDELELEYDEVRRLLSPSASGRSRRQVREERGSDRLAVLVTTVVHAARENPGMGIVALRKAVGGRGALVDQAVTRALQEGRLEDRGEATHGGLRPPRAFFAVDVVSRVSGAVPVASGQPVKRRPGGRVSPVKGTHASRTPGPATRRPKKRPRGE